MKRTRENIANMPAKDIIVYTKTASSGKKISGAMSFNSIFELKIESSGKRFSGAVSFNTISELSCPLQEEQIMFNASLKKLDTCG